jgi:hypothetical protein
MPCSRGGDVTESVLAKAGVARPAGLGANAHLCAPSTRNSEARAMGRSTHRRPSPLSIRWGHQGCTLKGGDRLVDDKEFLLDIYIPLRIV